MAAATTICMHSCLLVSMSMYRRMQKFVCKQEINFPPNDRKEREFPFFLNNGTKRECGRAVQKNVAGLDQFRAYSACRQREKKMGIKRRCTGR